MKVQPAFVLGEACSWLEINPESRIAFTESLPQLVIWDLTDGLEYRIYGQNNSYPEGFKKRMKKVPRHLNMILRASDQQLRAKLRWPGRLLTALQGDVGTVESERASRVMLLA